MPLWIILPPSKIINTYLAYLIISFCIVSVLFTSSCKHISKILSSPQLGSHINPWTCHKPHIFLHGAVLHVRSGSFQRRSKGTINYISHEAPRVGVNVPEVGSGAAVELGGDGAVSLLVGQRGTSRRLRVWLQTWETSTRGKECLMILGTKTNERIDFSWNRYPLKSGQCVSGSLFCLQESVCPFFFFCSWNTFFFFFFFFGSTSWPVFLSLTCPNGPL